MANSDPDRAGTAGSTRLRRWRDRAEKGGNPPGLFARAVAWVRAHPLPLLLGLAVSAAGATAALIGDIGKISEPILGYVEKQSYLAALQHPAPAKLQEADITSWGTGRMELEKYRILAFSGQFPLAALWLKQCIQNEIVFDEKSTKGLNLKYPGEPSALDRSNIEFLNARIDQIVIGRDEETEYLRINDPFTRLLRRAQKQLIHAHQEKDIKQLEKSQIYLLRNAIYAKHGRAFDTPKLRKYFNRQSWYTERPDFNESLMNPVELCNAIYLEAYYPDRDVGAAGRAVIMNRSFDPVVSALQADICGCVKSGAVSVDCRFTEPENFRQEFRDFGDLVMNIEVGRTDAMRWYSLNHVIVASQDFENYIKHEATFLSAINDIGTKTQAALNGIGRHLDVAYAQNHDNFLGADFSFSPATLQAISRNAAGWSQTVSGFCKGTRDLLERFGPYVPRVDGTMTRKQIVDGVFDSTGNELTILQKPILYGDTRRRLTLLYLKEHYGRNDNKVTFKPRMIVLHATEIDSLQASFGALQPETLPNSRTELKRAGDLNVSAHYLIDRDGTVYQLMPDHWVARHTIGLNRSAIGIENVGATDPPTLTSAQVSANVLLVAHLAVKYQSIQWLIGHHEYSKHRGGPLWEERDNTYFTHKSDPGDKFMAEVRVKLKDKNVNMRAYPAPKPDQGGWVRHRGA